MVDLEASPVMDLEPYISVETTETIEGGVSPHVIFEGVNIHVHGGSGETDDDDGSDMMDDADESESSAGLGNLIIGYNERDSKDFQDRSGSHNLMIGPKHSYSGSGGLVVGRSNSVSGISASISRGRRNTASGKNSSVVGGEDNEAIENASVVGLSSSSAEANTTERGLVELATDAETQAGTDTERAVTPASLNSALEVLGSVLPAGTVPSGFLPCDGSAVSRTDYDDLFRVIGTTWGAGDGSTTFNVPDLRRRVMIGSGGTQVAGPGPGVGDPGGAEQQALNTGQLLSHSHRQSSHNSIGSHSHSVRSHTHSGPSHPHYVPSHTHAVRAHRHTTPNHTYTVEYRDESGW